MLSIPTLIITTLSITTLTINEIQHNDAQYNNTQLKDIQNNDTQWNYILIATLNIKCVYAECYAERRILYFYAACRSAKCL